MKKILVCGIVFVITMGISACSEKTKESNSIDSSSSFSMEDLTEEGNDDGVYSKDIVMEDKQLSSTDTGIEAMGTELVGIKAHVKENNGNSLLISSDSDDYPGVFIVTGLDEITEAASLQGGTAVHILMQNLHQEDEQGIAKYKAEEITPLSGDEGSGQEDILLTEVPNFELWDVLSEQTNCIELRSGNYSWNVEEKGEGTGVTACGVAPLEEAGNSIVKLKVPEYNNIDGALYGFSTKIAPDILTVRRWNVADINNDLAMEEKIITYYYKTPVLSLQAGKVYEFSAEWKKENAGKNRFYGNANYVLVTE